MLNNRLPALTISGLLLLLWTATPAYATELSTLFTTPAERQIINSNRYKREESRPEPVEARIEAPIQQLIQEEVTFEYRISGITVSGDGLHTVWINSVAYEDGEKLEDNSKIKVLVGDGVKVRITAPDGKHYYATSGEALEVKYQQTVSN